MSRTGRRTQAGLASGKDDHAVWHESDRKDRKQLPVIGFRQLTMRRAA